MSLVAVPAPSTTGTIPDASVAVDGADHVVDVASYFTGAVDSYAASSDDTDKATVVVSNTSTVTVTGVAAGTATITVTATNAGGSAQQTFIVTVTAPTAPAGPPEITIAAASPVTEADGAEATFTLTADAPAPAGGLSVAVGVATGGGEYVVAESMVVVAIAGGATEGTLAIPIVNDNVDEPDGTVTATLMADVADPVTYTLGSAVTVTVTVNDDEVTPTVTLVLTPPVIPESGGSSTVTATLSGPSSAVTTIDVNNIQDLVDSTNRRLTIAAGDTESTGLVTAGALNDDGSYPDIVSQVTATAANAVGVLGPAPVTLTVIDKDTINLQLVLTPAEIDENGGSTTVTATIDRALATGLTLDVSVTPITPLTAANIVVSANRQLMIMAGATASTGTMTITAVDNAQHGLDKNVRVSATVNNEFATLQNRPLLIIKEDEATPTVSLVLSRPTITEGGATNESVIRATLSGPSDKLTVITVSAAGGGTSPAVPADFTLSQNTEMRINVGRTSSSTIPSSTVTITAVDNDVASPNKTIEVSGVAANDIGVNQPAPVILTIENNEAAVTVSAATVTEGTDDPDGPRVQTVDMVFTVAIAPTRTDVTIIAVQDVTAASGAANRATKVIDYQPNFAGLTVDQVRIPGGMNSATVTVRVIKDGDAEGDETIHLRFHSLRPAFVTLLDADGNAVDEITVVGTIVDDDQATVYLSTPDLAIGENGTAELLVNLEPASNQTVTVQLEDATPATDPNPSDDLRFATSVADYAFFNQTVTFNPGEKQKTVEINLVNDEAYEGDEILIARLASPVNAVILAADDSAKPSELTFTLEDEDIKPSISIDAPSVTEGDTGETPLVFTVRLLQSSFEEGTVDYAVSSATANDGTDTDDPVTLMNPKDYEPILTDDDNDGVVGKLTFAPGETEHTITVTVLGDYVREPDDSVNILLSNATADYLISRPTGNGQIRNDDYDTAPTLTQEARAALMGRLILLAVGETVNETFPEAEADSGNGDTTAPSYTYTLELQRDPPGSNDNYFPFNDALDVFFGDAGHGMTFAPETRTITGTTTRRWGNPLNARYIIHDNDSNMAESDALIVDFQMYVRHPEVTIAAVSASVAEGAPAQFRLTADPTPAADLSVTVTIAATGTRGVTEGDQTVTITAGQDERILDVTTTSDGVEETDDTVTATLTAVDSPDVGDATGYELGSPATATITVKDALPVVTIATAQVSVEEGASATYTLTADPYPAQGSGLEVRINVTGSCVTPVNDRASHLSGSDSPRTQSFNTATIDDDVDTGADCGAVTFTVVANAAYTIASPGFVTVTITDNDTRGITLATDPPADVTVTPGSTNITVASVSGPLTFTPDNWATAQTVTVTGGDNSGDTVATIWHSVAGGDYQALPSPPSFIVTVEDPAPNDAPAFIGEGAPGSTATRSLAENAAAGAAIGLPFIAIDPDNDAGTYTIEDAAANSGSAANFAIGADTGQLSAIAGGTYNYEGTALYSIVVVATDARNARAEQRVDVSVTDVLPPGRVSTPSVAAAASNRLTVTWTRPFPLDGGPAATYNVRYREPGATSWTPGPQNVAETSADIDHLAPGVEYEVQVRGVNPEGNGPWSLSAFGRTLPAGTPALTGITFANAPASSVAGTYIFEETIRVEAAFNRRVNTSGLVKLSLTIGARPREADFVERSGDGRRLIFAYEVQRDDADADGVSIPANAFVNGEDVTSPSGTPDAPVSLPVVLTHAAVSADATRKVDGGVGRPVAVGVIPPVELHTVDRVFQNVNPAPYFQSRGSITYTTEIRVGTSASARVTNDNRVRVDAVAAGVTIVTVTATNSHGSATQDVRVTVGSPPVPIFTFDNVTLTGLTSTTVDISGHFSNHLSDALTYTVYSNDPLTVRATRSGSIVTLQGLALGTANVTVTAANAQGSAQLSFYVTVEPGAPEAVNIGHLPFELVAGDAETRDISSFFRVLGSFTCVASSGNADVVTATAPSNDCSTLTVTAVGAGETTVTVTLTNSEGSASQTWDARVTAADTVETNGTIPDGSVAAGSFITVDAAPYFTGSVGVYTARSSDITKATVEIAGVSGIKVTATHSSGNPTATQTFTVTVADEAPVTPAPVASTALPDVSLLQLVDQSDDRHTSGPLTEHFTGVGLNYFADSSDTDVATAQIVEPGRFVRPRTSMVRVTAVGEGGATITVTAENAGGSVAQTFNVLVGDGVANIETVTFVSTPANDDTTPADATYGLGEIIRAEVAFDQKVTFTGTPRLPLTVGAETRQMTYDGGDKVLRFTYAVRADDLDADGVSITANALSGAITTDATGNAAVLTHAAVAGGAGHKVNGSAEAAPRVTAVEFRGLPVSGSTYTQGEVIQAVVMFDQRVTAALEPFSFDYPTLGLMVGRAEKRMEFGGADDEGRLHFFYIVQMGDTASNDLSIPADAITLNAMSITHTVNAELNAVLTHDAVAVDASRKVNGSVVRAPRVEEVAFRGEVTPANGDTFTLGEVIEAEVRFDRPVSEGFDGSGTWKVTLALDVGANTRQMAYYSQRGPGGEIWSGFDTADRYWFRYTVQADDLDADGVSIPANALAVIGGAIVHNVDETTDAVITHRAVANDPNRKVNGGQTVAPAVESVTLTGPTPRGGVYGYGDAVTARVTFDQPLFVYTGTGAPQLALTVGSETRQMDYAAWWSSGSNLMFVYVVQDGDTDNDGVSIPANALALNGGSITHAVTTTTNAVLTHDAVPNDPNRRVNGAAPLEPVEATTKSIPNVTGLQIGDDADVDLEEYFTGDVVSYTAVSSDPTKAKVVVDFNTVRVIGEAIGTVTITVTATGVDESDMAMQTYMVTVVAQDSSNPPWDAKDMADGVTLYLFGIPARIIDTATLAVTTLADNHASQTTPTGKAFAAGPRDAVLTPALNEGTVLVDGENVPVSGEIVTACMSGTGELAHYNETQWDILPDDKHTRNLEGAVASCANVTQFSPFALLAAAGANTAPTASIAANQETSALSGAALVHLRGEGSDAETAANALTFLWTQTGGTPTVALNLENTATANFTAPTVTADTDLTFRLTVTDEGGLSATADVTGTIKAPDEPAGGNVIWEAELTVGISGPFPGYHRGQAGSLTDDNFTVGGTDFTVNGLFLLGSINALSFVLNPSGVRQPDSLILYVDDVPYPIEGAPFTVQYNFPDQGLTWILNQTVQLRLVAPEVVVWESETFTPQQGIGGRVGYTRTFIPNVGGPFGTLAPDSFEHGGETVEFGFFYESQTARDGGNALWVQMSSVDSFAGSELYLEVDTETGPVRFRWDVESGSLLLIAGANTANRLQEWADLNWSAGNDLSARLIRVGIPVGPDGPIETDESFCGRTPEVQDAILSQFELNPEYRDITDCADVTAEHLEIIQQLELTELGIIDLKNHDFAGLVNLELLHLQGNALVEPPVLTDLEALRDLDISDNELASPPDLSTNLLLEALNLSNNPQMGEATGEGSNLLSLTGLLELRTLNLTNTGLRETPDFAAITDDDEIDPKLEEVYLGGNLLTVVPSVDAMKVLTELRVLHMNDNRLTGKMPNLTKSPKLEDLQLQNNRLSVPTGMGSNDALRTLYLHDNEFTDAPGFIQETPTLVDVRMQNNRLTAFPALTAAGANLQTLLLNGNRLASAPSVSANTALTTLRLDDNMLTSGPDVSANRALLYLSLSNNRLTSAPSLSANVELRELDLSGNLLTSAPDVSGNSQLLTLALSDNQMTGTLVLNGHQALATLLLDNNRLTGLTLGSGVALRTLHVHNNMLTALPDMSNRLRLTVFSVYNNPLTALPSLSANTGLREMWVGWHDPSLTALPSGFLSGLPSGSTSLYVEGFDLDASEMQTIGTRFAGLEQLHVGGSDITSDQVHGLLDNLPAGLTVLALDGIDLTGVTWSKLARLTALETLDVTGANLDDTAATAIADNAPAGLQSLWMSYNTLSSVPSLSRFGFLKSLHLEHNLITHSAVGGNAFSGPLHAGLKVRVTAGNINISISDAQLTTAHAGVEFESPNVVTSLSVAKTVVGTETTPNTGYEFYLSCDGPLSETRSDFFTRVAGDTGYVPVHAPGLLTASVHPDVYRIVDSATCTLTEPADGGATTTTGLFAAEDITRAGRDVAVVNTFGAGGPGVTIVTTPATTAPDYALTVIEGDRVTYTVVLDTQPTANVTVGPGSGNTAIATVSGALTFTTGNWQTPQTVTVTGVNSAVSSGITAIFHNAAGGGYDSVTATVGVTVTMRSITLVTDPPTTAPVYALTVTEGGTETYTVVLDTQPAANVTVTPGSSNTAIVTVSGPLTFTASDWSTAQTVTVTGVSSTVSGGVTTISHTVAGVGYSSTTADVDVIVVPRGITLETDLTVAENAGTETYTVVLDTQPTADVTVALTTSGDTGAVTLSTPTLTFTTGNWNVAQTVTVTGVNDDIDNANDRRTATITHTANGGGYVNVAAALAVTVTDDDTHGITLATDPPSDPPELRVPEIGMATYTVVLDNEPAATVTVTVESVSNRFTVAPPSLDFTTDNWNVPQTVTVTGVNDDLTTGNLHTAIFHYADTYIADRNSIDSMRIVFVDDDLLDYDADDDNLIEIANLAQLNAMRWDLNGDSAVEAGNQAAYDLAFPNAAANMGCLATCAGYELTADLDFDTHGGGTMEESGDYWNDGAGWAPIGGSYNAEFHGNGYTIANLFINRGSANNVGLFSQLGNDAYVHHVGLIDVDVTGQIRTGALAGNSPAAGSRIAAVYVNGGSVTGHSITGGLIGSFAGTLTAVWTNVDVQSTHDGSDDVSYTGGIIASLSGSASASYAIGSVTTPSFAESDARGGVAADVSGTLDTAWFNSDTVGGVVHDAAALGKTTVELQTPTDDTGIYADWDVDFDGERTAENPWDFGSSADYPILKADRDNDGAYTWQEFGDQGRVEDVTADALVFTDATAPAGTTATSDPAAIAGINAPVPLAVSVVPSDATFTCMVDGTTDCAAGLAAVSAGQTVTLTTTAGATDGDTVVITVILGANSNAVSSTWTLTTGGAAVAPPVAAGPIPDITMATSALRNVDVVSYFTGTVDSYAATSADNTAVGATVTGSVIALTTFAIEATVRITVTATNTGGSATQTFDVTVSAAPPVASQTIPDVSVDVGADQVVAASLYFTGAVSYTASSSAPDKAAVSVAATLVTVTGVAVGTADITVTATNPGGSTDQTFTVTVTAAVNQAPTFDEGPTAARSLPENSASGQSIGLPLTATDPDNDTLTYTLSGTDAASFDINASTGQLLTKANTAYDFETKDTYFVTVGVSDGSLSDSINVTINVTDANDAPVFTEGASATREFPENTAAGTNIGLPLTATDEDRPANTLSYTLSGTDAASFNIAQSTGQLSTKAGVTYDYETKSTYSVTVVANDGRASNNTASIAVTINLTDVAEGVQPPGTTGSIPAASITVGADHVVDAAPFFTGTVVSYAASSSATDKAIVAVSNTSTVTVTGVAEGTATITVTATNAVGSAMQTFTVTVTPFVQLPAPENIIAIWTDGKVALEWDPVTDADSYIVQWKSGSEEFDSTRQTMVAVPPDDAVWSATMTAASVTPLLDAQPTTGFASGSGSITATAFDIDGTRYTIKKLFANSTRLVVQFSSGVPLEPVELPGRFTLRLDGRDVELNSANFNSVSSAYEVSESALNWNAGQSVTISLERLANIHVVLLQSIEAGFTARAAAVLNGVTGAWSDEVTLPTTTVTIAGGQIVPEGEPRVETRTGSTLGYTLTFSAPVTEPVTVTTPTSRQAPPPPPTRTSCTTSIARWSGAARCSMG